MVKGKTKQIEYISRRLRRCKGNNKRKNLKGQKKLQEVAKG